MLLKKSVALIGLFLFFFSGCSSPVELAGDVFIVTQGGQSIKLGLVDIHVMPEDTIKPFIQSKMQTAKSDIPIIFEHFKREINQTNTIKELDDLKMQIDKTYNNYEDGSFFISELPATILTTKTDADGKFMLKLKPGKYAIAANSHRKIIDSIEIYNWLVWITVRSKQPNRVMLSNDNLFETHCGECIISLEQIQLLLSTHNKDTGKSL